MNVATKNKSNSNCKPEPKMSNRTTKKATSTITASALKMQMSNEATAMVLKILFRSIEAVRTGVACDASDLGIICAHVFAIAEQIDNGQSDNFLLGLSGDASKQVLKELIQQGDEFPWKEVCGHRVG